MKTESEHLEELDKAKRKVQRAIYEQCLMLRAAYLSNVDFKEAGAVGEVIQKVLNLNINEV